MASKKVDMRVQMDALRFLPALLSRRGASELPMNMHSDGASDGASIRKKNPVRKM